MSSLLTLFLFSILINLSFSYDKNTCLVSEEYAKEALKTSYEMDDSFKVDDRVRFILGTCSPLIYVPGLFGTDLHVLINCKGLYKEDNELYKKMKFFCPNNNICSNLENENEEHFLYESHSGEFNIENEEKNKYSTCIGFFLSMYNQKSQCATNSKTKQNTCNSSKYVKIGLRGFTPETKAEGSCGEASFFTTENEKIFKPLGYETGFSFATISYDYRQFSNLNDFFTKTFRYEVETLFNNTGKPVVIIAFSMGNIMTLNNLLKKENADLIPKIKKFVSVAPPYGGASSMIDYIVGGMGGMTPYHNSFGFGLVQEKIGGILDLTPSNSLVDLVKGDKFNELFEAINERINLEIICRGDEEKQICTRDYIEKNSFMFNKLFKDRYPLLTEDVCKENQTEPKEEEYEREPEEEVEPEPEEEVEDEKGDRIQLKQKLRLTQEKEEVFPQKCFTNMFNLFNCPTVMLTNTKEGDIKEPEHLLLYCNQKAKDVYFYNQKCSEDSEKSCLEDFYVKRSIYNLKDTEKRKYLMDKYNENAQKNNLKPLTEEEANNLFESEDTYRESLKEQIAYRDLINHYNENFTIPPVDTDILFEGVLPTTNAIIYDDKGLFSSNKQEVLLGGDSLVPSWSVLLPYFKWVVDLQKNKELKQEIKLIDFCSPLSLDTKYSYDNENHIYGNYSAMRCSALNDDGTYDSEKLKTMGHSTGMTSDSNVIDFYKNEVNDPKNKEPVFTSEKKISLLRYNSNRNIDYLQKCNDQLADFVMKEKDDKEDEKKDDKKEDNDEKKKEGNSFIVFIIVVLIIILVGVIGFIVYAGLKFSRKNKLKSQVLTTSFTKDENGQPISDDLLLGKN